MAKGWKGFFGEDKMSDDDWGDRAARAAVDQLNMIPVEQSVTDDEGTPTYGVYNDDYSEQEHKDANRLFEEDPEYAEEQTRGAQTLNYLEKEGFL